MSDPRPTLAERIYFDTEFIEDGRTIDLLSIGLVRADGSTYYAEPAETDRSRASKWVQENVLPHLTGPVRPRAQIAREVVAFVGPHPEFWAWYADYDWVALCQLFGTMMDLPDGWPMFCRDLRQVTDGNVLPQQGASDGPEHHALSDARWLARVAALAEDAAEPAPAADEREVQPLTSETGIPLTIHEAARYYSWALHDRDPYLRGFAAGLAAAALAPVAEARPACWCKNRDDGQRHNFMPGRGVGLCGSTPIAEVRPDGDALAAVRALVFSEEADRFREEAAWGRAQLPYASNRYVRLLDDLRAALAATGGGTSETGGGER